LYHAQELNRGSLIGVMNYEFFTDLFIPHALSAKTLFIRGRKQGFSLGKYASGDTYPSAVLLIFAC
jgi:hypothetical protein